MLLLLPGQVALQVQAQVFACNSVQSCHNVAKHPSLLLHSHWPTPQQLLPCLPHTLHQAQHLAAEVAVAVEAAHVLLDKPSK